MEADVNSTVWDYNDKIIEPSLLAEAFSAVSCPFCSINLSGGMISKRDWYNFCPICGWWKICNVEVNNVPLSNERKEKRWASTVRLRQLDLSDMSLPLSEIRSYLAAKFSERYSLNPRKFEEVVASVFYDLGYQTRITGYSNDGGIDVVLDGDDDSTIGVQVKRYKNNIHVEQIRAFAGALVLKGHTKGIYVTTSDYQSGCETTVNDYKLRGIQIELLNADKFFEALKIAQKAAPDMVKFPGFSTNELYCIGEFPYWPELNSLSKKENSKVSTPKDWFYRYDGD